MFIGLGVGMIFGKAGAGVLIGMGVGFILASLVGRVERRYVIRVPRSIASAVLVALGAAFIMLGLESLGLIPEAATKVIWGLFFVLLGIALVALGFKVKLEK